MLSYASRPTSSRLALFTDRTECSAVHCARFALPQGARPRDFEAGLAATGEFCLLGVESLETHLRKGVQMGRNIYLDIVNEPRSRCPPFSDFEILLNIGVGHCYHFPRRNP